MLNLWNWNSWNGNGINIEFILKLAELYIIDCDLLFCNRNDQLMKTKFDCWNGRVYGYDVSDNDRNDVLTIIEII